MEDCEFATHLADKDGAAEKLLVAELADRALRLFGRAVLDDAADACVTRQLPVDGHRHHHESAED